MDRPDLSVIVVAFGGSGDVAACLDSVRREAGRAGLAAELIVVDNGGAAPVDVSADAVLRPGRNLGFGAAVNRGFRASRGRRVLLLNPDAALRDGALSRLSTALDGGAALAAPTLMLPSGSRQESPRAFYDLEAVFARRTPWGRTRSGRRAATAHLARGSAGVDWVTGAAMLFERDEVPEGGPFDERYFLYFEDVDLCRSLRARGRTVAFVDDAVADHVFGGGSRSMVPWNPLLWRHAWSGVLYALRWSRGWFAWRGLRGVVASGAAAALRLAALVPLAMVFQLSPALAGASLLVEARRRPPIGEAPRPSLVRTAAGLVAGAFAVLLALAAFGAAVGREQAVGAAAFGLAGALSLDLLHRVGDSVRGFFARRGLFRRAVIVAGEPAAASTIAQAITDSAAGVHVLGFVPRDPLAIGGPGPRLGGWDDIATLAADFRADAVLIAGSPDDLAQMAGGVAALRARAVPSAFVLEGSSELLQADAPDTLAGYPVLPLGAAGPVDALARGLGRLVAALALILSLPAFLPLLLLSALVFGGRPLVREPRVGLGGVRFSMWRLRTSPEAKAPTLSSWLRRLHLDEWPQLLNVLRGEMALVGPRPVADDVWATLFPWQQARAAARPGLTGMWQLDRLRRWRLPQMIASDLLYLLRWSPALDVRILLRTLLGRGSA